MVASRNGGGGDGGAGGAAGGGGGGAIARRRLPVSSRLSSIQAQYPSGRPKFNSISNSRSLNPTTTTTTTTTATATANPSSVPLRSSSIKPTTTKTKTRNASKTVVLPTNDDHPRRRYDAQVILSHPIISKSLLELQTQSSSDHHSPSPSSSLPSSIESINLQFNHTFSSPKPSVDISIRPLAKPATVHSRIPPRIHRTVSLPPSIIPSKPTRSQSIVVINPHGIPPSPTIVESKKGSKAIIPPPTRVKSIHLRQPGPDGPRNTKIPNPSTNNRSVSHPNQSHYLLTPSVPGPTPTCITVSAPSCCSTTSNRQQSTNPSAPGSLNHPKTYSPQGMSSIKPLTSSSASTHRPSPSLKIPSKGPSARSTSNLPQSIHHHRLHHHHHHHHHHHPSNDLPSSLPISSYSSTTIPHPNRNSHLEPKPPSNDSSTSHGRMSPTRSDYPEYDVPSQEDTTTKVSSSSLLSTSTVKPHCRTSSETSSTDLRGTKLKVKDRSRQPSISTVDEPPHSLPRSKRLISMKDRNERIFATINASLNSSPLNHIVEPPLPPPPPSASSSGSSNSSPFSLHPHPSKNELGNSLRVPGSSARSGLIPFAKGCSPSPRKITGPQTHATNGKMDVIPSGLSRKDTEILQDAQSGSVRHKRSERSRLLKRTPVENPSSQSDITSSPPQLASSIHQVSTRDQVNTLPERHYPDSTNRPLSSDSAKSKFSRSSHELCESLSMHTSSSDTIGAKDGDPPCLSSSRGLIGTFDRNSSNLSAQSSWSEEQNDLNEYEEDETMITPVKTRRNDSFQKTLRHASSVSEALITHVNHQPAPTARRAPRPSVGHRRRSSSFNADLMDSSLISNSASVMFPDIQSLARSPPSQASLFRRSRPGLPDQFVNSRNSDRANSDGHDIPEARRSSEVHSSRSPRVNRTRLSNSVNLRHQQSVDDRPYRHSDTFSGHPGRTDEAESFSRYDGYHSYSGRLKHQSSRYKHASWSVLDDVGGEIVRSQSVLGGVFDPRTSELRGLPIRTRTSYTSPVSQRYVVYRRNEAEDDDDGQISMTTYTHSIPRKAGSAGSRSRTSEWAFEESDLSNRPVRMGSRLGGYNSLIMSPSRRKSVMEKDRTLRANGGSIIAASKAPNQMLRSSYQDKQFSSHNSDNHSSSSGTSSQQLQQSQRGSNHRQQHAHPPTKLNESLSRPSRPPTRANSSVAGGPATLLSPTPNVDHHNLLISAYEALGNLQADFPQQEGHDLHLTLSNLMSSVVKKSCEIDAALAQLNESSLNHQVEMELVDESVDRRIDGSQQTSHYSNRSPSSQVTRQKYRMMKDSLDHMTKAQARLVRVSNDQIRDLTEALICLTRLQRSKKDYVGARPANGLQSRMSVHDDPRDLSGSGGIVHKEDFRSGSRASGRFSQSHSPSKLRHSVDLSPLSDISSHDESPLARAKLTSDLSLRHGLGNQSRGNAHAIVGSDSLHHRACTISFTHERNLSANGLSHQPSRAKKHMSAMSSTSIRQLGEGFYDVLNQTANRSYRSDRSDSCSNNLTADEFGLYRKGSERTLRSPGDLKNHQQQDSDWSRTDAHSGHTIRGSQSSVIFPKTPPRIATASISQTNAHSHLSPTNPPGSPTQSRYTSQEAGSGSGHNLRPQSSMSQILHRANSVLSRVEHYPVVQTVPVGCKTNGKARERYSREMTMDEPISHSSRIIDHDILNNQQISSRTSNESEDLIDVDRSTMSRHPVRMQGHHWTNSTATAALEKFSHQIGGGRNATQHDVNRSMRSTTTSHLPSGGESEGNDDIDPEEFGKSKIRRSDLVLENFNNDRRRRKGSIHKLFGGLKKNSQAKR